MASRHVKTAIVAVVLVALSACASAPATSSQRSASSSASRLAQAFDDQESGLQIEGAGTVKRLLDDDDEGSRHQRFILELETGQTLLIAHNIDLAERIDTLEVGDEVQFYGVYEWNPKGGTVHWTHHDPKRQHIGGWLKHNGIVYQ